MREVQSVKHKIHKRIHRDNKDFILKIIQPGLAGLMDGSVSTLAPIFAAAFATHQSHLAFVIGLSAAVGAGISMAFAEALSDSGEISGRVNPFLRGGVTGAMTLLGGSLHTLPFLLPDLNSALTIAYGIVGFELITIATIRHYYFKMSFFLSIIQVVVGGVLVFISGILIGSS